MHNYPKELQVLLYKMEYEEDKIGRSDSKVLKYFDENKSYYLKIQKENTGLRKEFEITKWLKGKLPVAEVIYFNNYEDYDYFLISKVEGEILCSDYFLKNPNETIKFLAEGINLLGKVDITQCPFHNSLEINLENALFNIENNLVDTSDWENDNEFKNPMDLYRYLVENKPEVKDMRFTHGDYCLPNILSDKNKIKGFIDLGRAGIADVYHDIALCIRSIKHNFNTDEHIDLFFKYLGIEPNWEKVKYYTLLDELF